MICVNLCGGAAIGKSTLAAKLFVVLKEKGYLVEIAGDCLKNLVYEKAHQTMDDAEYMFAIQAHRLKMLAQAGIEIAICDAPLMVVTIYGSSLAASFGQYVFDVYEQYTNINFLLQRQEMAIADIRNGDVENLEWIDEAIQNRFKGMDIPFTVVNPCDANTVQEICSKVENCHAREFQSSC